MKTKTTKTKLPSKIWVIYWEQQKRNSVGVGKIAQSEGFFESEEAAQVQCDKINAPVLDHFNPYRDGIIQLNERKTADYEQKARAYKILVDSGEKPFFTVPPKPKLQTPPELQSFLEEHNLNWATAVVLSTGEESNLGLAQMNRFVVDRRLKHLS